MPDYTKHLDEIVRALSRPATPAWLIAALSAVLGLVGALVGQALQMLATDAYRRSKMRRVLYTDLAETFFAVDAIESFPAMSQPQMFQRREQEFQRHLKFDGERHLKANQETYIQLPERLPAESIYGCFHRILDGPDSNQVNVVSPSGSLQKRWRQAL